MVDISIKSVSISGVSYDAVQGCGNNDNNSKILFGNLLYFYNTPSVKNVYTYEKIGATSLKCLCIITEN